MSATIFRNKPSNIFGTVAGSFQTNLNAPYQLMKQLIPSIKQQKGSIINIGVSGLNFVHADVYSTAYTITKSALLMLTKSLAIELAPDQVRVNMISPGYLETSVDLPSDLSHIPLNRLGTLQEVADMVVYLLSEKASYITGQNIEIAGGNKTLAGALAGLRALDRGKGAEPLCTPTSLFYFHVLKISSNVFPY